LQAGLPVGVEIGEAASQPDAVKRSIRPSSSRWPRRSIVVLLVTFISLGIRTGMVVAISIPLVLAATFLAMDLFNVGLHKVSLGALVLALGLLVDDAIIAVEMMWVKMEQGWERTRAASFAYTSTAGPMLSGTLVTVAGFIPIALAKSATGEYAFAFFQINAIALLISWLAAVIAIPWLGYKLLPDPRAPRNPALIERRLPAWPACLDSSASQARPREDHDVYGTAFYPLPQLVAGACTGAGWSSASPWPFRTAIVGMGKVQKQFFPNSTRLELNVELRLPEGASITAIDAETRDWRNGWTRTRPNSTSSSTTSPTSAPARRAITWASTSNCRASNVSQFVIVTRSVEAREALRGRLIQLFENDGFGARANIARIENGPPVGYPVQYRVSGEDIAILRVSPARSPKSCVEPELSNVNFDWSENSPKSSRSRSTRTRHACSAFPARISPPCSTCR
jgi:multidrug efflux pump